VNDCKTESLRTVPAMRGQTGKERGEECPVVQRESQRPGKYAECARKKLTPRRVIFDSFKILNYPAKKGLLAKRIHNSKADPKKEWSAGR